MKRVLKTFLCAVMLIALVLPEAGLAAKKDKTVYILTVNADGARVRKEPNSSTDNVETSLKKGTNVFYLGKSGSWYKIRSEYGAVGYIFRGFMDYYGAVKQSSIYTTTKKVTVYKKPSLKAKRTGTLSSDQSVIVYKTSGSWALIHTISGGKGYVKLSTLKKQ